MTRSASNSPTVQFPVYSSSIRATYMGIIPQDLWRIHKISLSGHPLGQIVRFSMAWQFRNFHHTVCYIALTTAKSNYTKIILRRSKWQQSRIKHKHTQNNLNLAGDN